MAASLLSSSVVAGDEQHPAPSMDNHNNIIPALQFTLCLERNEKSTEEQLMTKQIDSQTDRQFRRRPLPSDSTKPCTVAKETARYSRTPSRIYVCAAYNLDLLHPCSSELSPQSFLWSHFCAASRHRCPFAHRNWSRRHATPGQPSSSLPLRQSM